MSDRDELRINADTIVDGKVHRTCPNCGESKPLDEFGLRKMAGSGKDGADLVTNQSWCRSCRTRKT
jgi:hypothetical protein